MDIMAEEKDASTLIAGDVNTLISNGQIEQTENQQQPRKDRDVLTTTTSQWGLTDICRRPPYQSRTHLLLKAIWGTDHNRPRFGP